MRYIIIFFLISTVNTIFASYTEDLDDLLLLCNVYEAASAKRPKHICEKELDENFEYYITNMKSHYSEKSFLCIQFIKIEDVKLKFKIWFSHMNFELNAHGIKYNKLMADTFESTVKFNKAAMIVVPHQNQSIPQIFGFKINNQDVCPFCGQRLEAKAVGLIKGGTRTVNHEYPWHATIYHYESSSLKYKCGGSIIRDNKIITAAHCVMSQNQKISIDKLVVRIEEGELLSSSKFQFKVFQSIVHDGYNHETFQHDIAILVLESSIDISHTANVRAVCLPTKLIKLKGNVGSVIGFGSTDRHTNESSILLATELPIVKQEDCRDSDPGYYNKHMFSTNFCAGKRDFGVCQGDSGGGFFMQNQEGLWFLKGITSNTRQDKTVDINPTCSGDNFALFTDVTKYSDWIENAINS